MADAIKGSRNRSAKYGALLDALRDRIMHFTPGTEVGTVQGLRREFKALWSAHREKPDGLVPCDDYSTRGVLQAMREIGVVPGKYL